MHSAVLPAGALRSEEITSFNVSSPKSTDGQPHPSRFVLQKSTLFVLSASLGFLVAWAVTGGSPSPRRECAGGWPVFASRSELLEDRAWAEYLTRVYGGVPDDPHAYPWCMGELWMFYTHALLASGVSDAPALVGKCPTDGGRHPAQHYEQHSYLSPLNVSWSWHPAPIVDGLAAAYPAFEPQSWVEVIHMGGIDDEHVGAWFLQAKGSGMSFNTGKTIVFDDHDDAQRHFGTMGVQDLGLRNEAMCANASLAGYDSIQFVRHTCDMMYGQCRNASSLELNFFNVEIVSTKLVGLHSCTSNGSTPLIRSGWKGARPCTCDNSRSFLNCAEVSASTRVEKQSDHWKMGGKNMKDGAQQMPK
ncbi:hypothetical protein AB1Y20_010132 [Prymnesium parvum]|uniref:Phospholipase B-like n=1 Tax=Prymnesium parvum TaxID=97485 RepID=A0AB34K6K3_PRYPA